jgi:beta-lactam-binding protein with PASTA domain
VVSLSLAGQDGVPADATAVVLNVTATAPAAAGYLTVYPCGTPPPTASNVNYRPGESVPNLVVVKIGDGGSVCIATFAQTHVVVDLSGYHELGGSSFVPLFPARLRDTRTTTQVHPGGVVAVPVVGVAAPLGAVGAVFNVTVTNPQDSGFVTAYACDETRPLASNLNYVTGQTVANLAMLGLGKSGSLCLFSSAATDVVVDITGYFVPNGNGGGFIGITPTRVLDTRSGTHVNANETRTVPLTGLAAGAAGVVANVTATNTAAPGYLTAFPCGQNPPNASNVNYRAGDTVPNLVAIGVGQNNAICVFSFAAADVIVDLAGFYGPPTCQPTNTVGMDQTTAQSTLTGEGCSVTVTTSNVAPFDGKTVVAQNPTSGSYPQGSNVTITVAIGPSCEPTNTVGMDQATATKALASEGCSVTVGPPADLAPFDGNTVVLQNPTSGSYPPGYVVTINVAAPEPCTPPNTVGMNQATAKSALEGAHCNVFIDTANAPPYFGQIVIKQNQTAPIYPPGSTVTITVAEPPAPNATTPDAASLKLPCSAQVTHVTWNGTTGQMTGVMSLTKALSFGSCRASVTLTYTFGTDNSMRSGHTFVLTTANCPSIFPCTSSATQPISETITEWVTKISISLSLA